jgi:hypothetical protein
MTRPAPVIRAALAAREVIHLPILAWIAGVPAAAILWGVEVRTLLTIANAWLDSWRGIGDIEAGMRRRGFDLYVCRYDGRG